MAAERPSVGFAGAGQLGQLFIDTSTIDATKTRQMAQRLTDETGMRWIDAPVSGGAAAALTGSMTVMAGGAVEDFEAARPLWDALSGQCTLMGPTGAGQSTKMINQVLVLGDFAPVAEAAALAINAGIDAALCRAQERQRTVDTAVPHHVSCQELLGVVRVEPRFPFAVADLLSPEGPNAVAVAVPDECGRGKPDA